MLPETIAINPTVDEQVGQLLEFMPNAVVVACDDGTIAFVNRHAARLLGYASDELIGLPLTTIIPDRFRDAHQEIWETCFAQPADGPLASSELWACRKNGQEVAMEISLSPLETACGRLIMVSFSDVSERRAAESKLRSALAEVEQLRDRLKAENSYLREEFQSTFSFDDFIGKTAAFKRLIEQIHHVATTYANVLIQGETGSGKELVARLIHTRSNRKDRPLVKMNCAALPSSLIESELFGHERGSFTGAIAQKIGRFELADEGTIFLDEIGELPLELQALLLRAVEERVFWRVGSTTPTKVNVRVIAATNRDLQLAMQDGSFRPDLYYRLAVFPIEVPPLRDRREDIPLLVWHYLAKNQARLGKNFDEIPETTMDRLVDYSWPGNIRELENVIERAMILSPGPKLNVETLSDIAPVQRGRVPNLTNGSADNVMRNHILSVLEECRWQIKGPGAAAERLGMHPNTLRYRMKKLGIKRP